MAGKINHFALIGILLVRSVYTSYYVQGDINYRNLSSNLIWLIYRKLIMSLNKTTCFHLHQVFSYDVHSKHELFISLYAPLYVGRIESSCCIGA